MDTEKFNFVKKFEDKTVRLNQYVDIPNSTIKTLLYFDEQFDFLEIVENDSNSFKIENVSGTDLSYFYFVFTIVACRGTNFEPPVSENNRLRISVLKNENNYKFTIFDSFSNITYILNDMSQEIIIKLHYIFRVYKFYMYL
ncbi:MAG: hypothetical protein MJZ33_05290 [Paludibacteraceae bacterium]|nr:hypothetical protein [Paludibacteraceae bacterium]